MDKLVVKKNTPIKMSDKKIYLHSATFDRGTLDCSIRVLEYKSSKYPFEMHKGRETRAMRTQDEKIDTTPE